MRTNGVPHPPGDPPSQGNRTIREALFQERKFGNNFFQQSFEPHSRRAISNQPVLCGVGLYGDQQVDRSVMKVQLVSAAKETRFEIRQGGVPPLLRLQPGSRTSRDRTILFGGHPPDVCGDHAFD